MSKATINLLFLAFLILGLIFLWWPRYLDLNLLRFQVAQKRLELQTKAEYFDNLRGLSLKLKWYNEQLAKMDSALPDFLDLPDVLNFVQRESAVNGLILEDVGLAGTFPLSPGSKIKKTSLDISLSGFYPSFLNFLSVLQESARLIDPETISFSVPEEGELYSFRLKIKFHSY